MKDNIDRREFLKLTALFTLTHGLYLLPNLNRVSDNKGEKNIIVLVFDAWSAKNMSLHGYQRDTTPNLNKILDRAIVYHDHYAGANWTVPGTYSLLTGAYPWPHRGFNTKNPLISRFSDNNLFSLFPDHFRIAYTHNPVSERVIKDFLPSIEHYQPRQSLFLEDDMLISTLFMNDYDIASLNWTRGMKKSDDGYAYSLFLSNVWDSIYLKIREDYLDKFPLGPPAAEVDNFFLLENSIDWIQKQSNALSSPFLGYFHLLPPHGPYRPRSDYLGFFKNDDYSPKEKPVHFLANAEKWKVHEHRALYDEYILFVDSEIKRLFDYWEQTGLLENSIVVITSDHGEMFERGIEGHRIPVFHEPIIKVPLIIFDPENDGRKDIYSPTSAVDLLPTLLKMNGKDIPESIEGEILPPYIAKNSLSQRAIFAVDGRDNDEKRQLNRATVMMLKGRYKLIYYIGYEELQDENQFFELYDLENDPEEIVNLYSPNDSFSIELVGELFRKIQEVDEPFVN